MDAEFPGSYFYGVNFVRDYILTKLGEDCPAGWLEHWEYTPQPESVLTKMDRKQPERAESCLLHCRAQP